MIPGSRVLISLVLLVGALNAAGYLTGIEAIRKIGQVSAASPLPLVFSHFRGLETFSPSFSVIAGSPNEIRGEIPITPSNYGALRGPYNRRNVYGVAFAFAAVLQEPSEQVLVEEVLKYALCPGGSLRNILEKSPNTRVAKIDEKDEVGIRIVPKKGTPVDIWVVCTYE